ncbi:uncharacterized protein LOC119680950 [Teleopsis dalmanni]|uniref:uncharacterized protein LOC119680950 n=1 Tax=Teleopsis dalmanni TaxID=139649 RepID=UPI0018CE43B3|nr:uncharacterized protein LOC119680950 [Teleopsis dalmanni]
MNVVELVKASLLPELKQNFDDIPITPEHFEEYVKIVELNLRVLFKFLSEQPRDYWTSTEEKLEFDTYLILLLCEVTASNTYHKISNEEMVRHANLLLNSHKPMEPEVEDKIFSYYQAKLEQNVWKTQYGAINGFLRYIEFRYSQENKMKMNWMNFCLAIGLRLRESVETVFKHISLKIFKALLQFSEPSKIKDTNIHSVIYDAVYKDVHYMSSEEATTDIWTCLSICVKFYENIDSTNWSYVDDMIEVLMRNIPINANDLISLSLLRSVTKLGYFFSTNCADIERAIAVDFKNEKELDECRSCCRNNNSRTTLRWAKSILELFVVESYKLLSKQDLCVQLLEEIHRCYMVYILAIPLSIVELHLITFFEKFITVLMEVMVLNEKDEKIAQLIKALLTTFLHHLQNSSCEINEKLLCIQQSLLKLIKLDFFM